MDKELVPELRFEGFEEPWEEKKFGEMANVVRGLTYSPDDIVNPGQGVRVLRSSNIVGDQFQLSDSDVFVKRDAVDINFAENGDILITAANGSSKLVGKRAKIENLSSEAVHGGFMLRAISDDSDYLNAAMGASWYRVFLSVGVSGGNGALGNLDKNALIECNVPFPSQSERIDIGSLYRSLDSLIAEQEKECAALGAARDALLDKMFPKEGETAPELRFDGFSGPWERVKLGELYSVNNERNESRAFGFDRTMSIATMTLTTNQNTADSSLPTYKVIRVGDAAFEGHTNKHFAYGRFVVNALTDGIMSPRFTCLRPKRKYPVQFWKYYINNERVMRPILIRSTKMGTMMNELVPSDYFNQQIIVPSYEEQDAIGTVLALADSQIEAEAKKLDLLKQLKGAMLDKMFPKGAR